MAKENKTENTNTITTNRWSSERSVQETLFLSSSKESLMYEIMFYFSFLHGLRGSNSRHLATSIRKILRQGKDVKSLLATKARRLLNRNAATTSIVVLFVSPLKVNTAV